MTRSSIIVASVFTLIAFPPLLSTMTMPAAAQEQEWSNNDMGDEDLRDFLMGRSEDRMDRRMDRREDRRERRRERISSRWDDDEDAGGRDRGDLRERLRERLAERHGGNCYILTRGLRDEDNTLLAVVRRRVCRD